MYTVYTCTVRIVTAGRGITYIGEFQESRDIGGPLLPARQTSGSEQLVRAILILAYFWYRAPRYVLCIYYTRTFADVHVPTIVNHTSQRFCRSDGWRGGFFLCFRRGRKSRKRNTVPTNYTRQVVIRPNLIVYLVF